MAASLRQVQQPQQPIRVAMDLAFEECLDIVLNALKSRGEQWTPDAKQDAVSTLLINAQKMGHVGMWEPPRPQAVSPRPAASAETSQLPPVSPTPDPSTAPSSEGKRSPLGRGPLEAFARLKSELPWPTYRRILADFGVKEPDEFGNENLARGCYAVMASARDRHLQLAADPFTFEHFEAGEGSWL